MTVIVKTQRSNNTAGQLSRTIIIISVKTQRAGKVEQLSRTIIIVNKQLLMGNLCHDFFLL